MRVSGSADAIARLASSPPAATLRSVLQEKENKQHIGSSLPLALAYAIWHLDSDATSARGERWRIRHSKGPPRIFRKQHLCRYASSFLTDTATRSPPPRNTLWGSGIGHCPVARATTLDHSCVSSGDCCTRPIRASIYRLPRHHDSADRQPPLLLCIHYQSVQLVQGPPLEPCESSTKQERWSARHFKTDNLRIDRPVFRTTNWIPLVAIQLPVAGRKSLVPPPAIK